MSMGKRLSKEQYEAITVEVEKITNKLFEEYEEVGNKDENVEDDGFVHITRHQHRWAFDVATNTGMSDSRRDREEAKYGRIVDKAIARALKKGGR